MEKCWINQAKPALKKLNKNLQGYHTFLWQILDNTANYTDKSIIAIVPVSKVRYNSYCPGYFLYVFV